MDKTLFEIIEAIKGGFDLTAEEEIYLLEQGLDQDEITSAFTD
jgi:hypothetical protein